MSFGTPDQWVPTVAPLDREAASVLEDWIREGRPYGLDASDCDFSGSDLSGVDFSGACLIDAKFVNVVLERDTRRCGSHPCFALWC
ncbi:pentapeptide repeat-containing protein [Nocardia sp. NPDC088792]|uniref:pentapeptide repeat-containing protein n=1 Tax=Nocardia sp. NPDC088792 TaxID=3364332 RepID=UPI003812F1B4